MGLREVLQEYDLPVKSLAMVRDKGKKAVWHLRTADKDYFLKKLSFSRPRMMFVVSATRHLYSRGARVPEVIPTRTGQAFVEATDHSFVMYGSITGRKPEYAGRDMALILKSLAHVHKASQGFVPPEEAEKRSFLGCWPDFYRKKFDELDHLKLTASQSGDRFSTVFLQYADHFADKIRSVLDQMESIGYQDWVERLKQTGCLCHQDYAAKNLRVGQDGHVQVFDMDAIAHDLPARDIRKIFNKVMKKKRWHLPLALDLMGWYHAEHPLSPQEWKVTLLDMEFPHLFCGIVNKYYTGRGDPDWTEDKYLTRLQDMVQVELSKESVLREVRARLQKTPEG